MIKLVIFRGDTLLDVVQSAEEAVTIGRTADNTVVLDHPSVSREHARISRKASGLEVVDLNSKLGVTIRGVKVSAAPILHGDVLQIGDFKLHVLAGSAPGDEGAAEPAAQEASYRALESMFLLASKLSSTADTSQLLESMIDILIDIFRAERGQILLADAKSGKLSVAFARKMDPAAKDWAISETIAREALKRRVPILTTDALAEAKFQTVESIQREQVRSVVCVPLVRRDSSAAPLGVLYLDSRSSQKIFSERDLKLLDTFASHASAAIEASREKDRLNKQVRSLTAVQREQSLREHNFTNMVAVNRKMLDVMKLVGDVSREDVTTLILGESGTGKELIAKAIHYGSRRKDKPFVAVNCMALSPEIIESELFGHEKGAFTGATDRRVGRFELADGGTIFLDEIGELTPAIQVKLLRVLQERQVERVGSSRPLDVDVRLVAATNADLQKSIKAGQFREDLYYRLNVFRVSVPPLRQRMEDIPPLVDHFIGYFNKSMGRKVSGIDQDALNSLMSYSWPGNIRELRNVIERAFVVERSDRITAASLPYEMVQQRGLGFSAPDLGVDNYPPDFHLAKELFEKNFILKYLRANNGNITATANQVGLPRKTIYRKLEAYQIPREELADDGPPEDDEAS